MRLNWSFVISIFSKGKYIRGQKVLKYIKKTEKFFRINFTIIFQTMPKLEF